MSDLFGRINLKRGAWRVSGLNLWGSARKAVIVVLFALGSRVQADSFLALDGGFEGAATIDNTGGSAGAQAGKWTRASTVSTIANETTVVRSGANSMKISSASGTGAKIYSPLFTIPSSSSKWYVQFYRRSASTVNTQTQGAGNSRGGTDANGGYTSITAADTWEKVTYAPSATTPVTTVAGYILNKALGSGGDTYIDDFVVYADTTVDNTPPGPPTAPLVAGASSTSLAVSWTAPAGGVDGGGYLVVRGLADPTTAPNANGIYAINNSVAAGQTVVYQGGGTSFTDASLTTSTPYYYRIYTYDKAYNYCASPITGNGTPLAPSPVITAPGLVSDFGGQRINAATSANSYSLSGSNLSPASGNLTVSPPAGFEVSLDQTTWVANPAAMNVPYAGGALMSSNIYVRFKPTSVASFTGNIGNAGGGVGSTVYTAVSGTGCDAPSAASVAASGVGVTNAALNGVVNASNATATVTFQYGFDASYGTTVPGLPGTVSGVGDTSVSTVLTGLIPNTNYHFRVVASNLASVTYGSDLMFTTLIQTPTNLHASATNITGFTAAWDAVGGAQGYQLDVSTNSGFIGPLISTNTIFRETMGNPGGTVSIAAHEIANGFDTVAYTMSSGGVASPADVRGTLQSSVYVDPAGNTASGAGNIYFTTTAGDYGFSIAGIDASGYTALRMSFGYYKNFAASNALFHLDWSTNNGTEWNSITVSNLPAEGANSGWYMVSNLSLSTSAISSTLSLRWVKTGGAFRIDDILLQGMNAASSYVSGFSNAVVVGAASTNVTGLTGSTPYYFRVRAYAPSSTSANSSIAAVTTLQQSSIMGAATATAFNTIYGTPSAAQSFTVSGANLTADLIATAPAGFEVSSDGSSFGATATFSQRGGSASGNLSVRLAATATVSGAYNSSAVTLSSFGASSISISTASSGNSVAAASLIITANNVTNVFGTTLTGGSGSTAFTSSGLTNGEMIGTVTVSYGTGSGASDAVGTYAGQAMPSAAAGGTFSPSNYDIHYNAGAITVVAPAIQAPTNVHASATSITAFTAAWDAVSGAQGYQLDVSTNSGFAGSQLRNTIFRETMGNPAGTVTIAAQESANGFDNVGYMMSGGGAANPGDVRNTLQSNSYIDPAGNTPSGGGNIYFTSSAGDYGFGISGIDASGYAALQLSFGYHKETAPSNAVFHLDWSTNNGTEWNAITVSNLPAEAAATGWYMVPNLSLPSSAVSPNLSLRWVKTGGAMRLDDIVLQGVNPSLSYVSGFSNVVVWGGATSAAVSGLSGNTPYYFRVRAYSAGSTSINSSTAMVTTLISSLTVALTNPVNGASFAAGVAIRLAATVTANATVTNVAFFDGGTLIGNNQSAPFSGTWTEVSAGNHVLKAIVWDNTGLCATSSVVNISVNGAFAPGNVVVYRVGDGLGNLANTGSPVFLDEYTPGGELVRSVALPTTAISENYQLIANGIAPSEGFLTRSVDGSCLVLTGYGTTMGGANLSSTAAVSVPRVVGVVSYSGALDTTTALNDLADGSTPRSAATTEGTNIWVGGAAGGVRFAVKGATNSTALTTASFNIRQLEGFGGQLFGSTQSGTNLLNAIGSGMPSNTSQTLTSLPGYSTNGSPNAFYMADLNGDGAVDTLYVADDASGLQKYSLVGGNWVANGTVGSGADAYRGLAGYVAEATNVILYVTGKGGSGSSGGGILVRITDTNGYNSSFSGASNLLAIAASKEAFRGVALAPFWPVKGSVYSIR
jgi:Bacterial Ig domain